MKKSSLLNVILAVAVVVLVAKLCAGGAPPAPSSAVTPSSAVVDNILTRTSIRAYTADSVADATMDTLLRAAMAAPSACDLRPWRFVVVDDRALLLAMADTLRTMQMLRQAPTAVVVCGDMSRTLDGDGKDYWIQDASAATENLLLAAHAAGLGAVWCGVTPQKSRVDFLSRLLQLPDSVVPLCVVALGYPAESPMPKDKWDASNVHHNAW